MKKPKLSPSLMCIDFAKIEQTLRIFEENGIDYLHIDIMDGEFVPNYALGINFCDQIRKLTKIPLDIHLMINRPDLKLDCFNIQPNEFVSVHWESTPHVQRTLAAIRAEGAKAMLAINPATPTEVIKYLLQDIDGILVMTVNPGFAGQPLVPAMLQKIRDTRNLLEGTGHTDVEIEVDGNVSFENAKLMREAGATMFVGGSSSIFFTQLPLSSNIQKMNAIIGK
ncbi:MAG TPA: ribulose-phosphate 3-epimerase [Candidatus Faecousia intestinigallinarum]|nr:ribulose-phosphate 3-epimerase [Candidatus Faecousia intestinigallinarum]